MKKNYLLYAITLIVVAIVMYHATYFFLWLSYALLFKYALTLLFVFILVSVILYFIFRETTFKPWVNVILAGWFLGVSFALYPTSTVDVFSEYNEGLIIRENLTSFGKRILVDKWGRSVIDGNCRYYYLINDNTIIGVNRNYDNEGLEVFVYENFNLKKIIRSTMKSSADTSIGAYIKEQYGRPIWAYCENTPSRSEMRLNDPIEIIEVVNVEGEVDTSDKENSNDNNGYIDLGLFDCNIQGVSENEIGGLISHFHLYVRNIDGDKYYYACEHSGERRYCPITRGSWTKGGEHFNARFHKGSSYYYLNISSWYDDDDNYDDDHVRNVPIKRDPVPVQEWVPCTGCNGSGKCNNCNGTGQNLYSTNYMECIGCGGSGRCEFCAGQGGHYETRYR